MLGTVWFRISLIVVRGGRTGHEGGLPRAGDLVVHVRSCCNPNSLVRDLCAVLVVADLDCSQHNLSSRKKTL